MWPEPYRNLRSVYGEYEGLSGELRLALGLQSERALALYAEEGELAEAYRRLMPHDSRGIADLADICKARTASLLADPDLPRECRGPKA